MYFGSGILKFLIQQELLNQYRKHMSSELTFDTNSFDTLGQYLKEIRKIPKLSASEEQELLFDFKVNNNLKAAQKIIMSNLRFVVFYAKKFNGYNLPLLDIIQEGNIGLMGALKNFDIESGVRFITFAVFRIKENIYNYVIDNYRIIKIATTKEQRKLFFNLRKLKTSTDFIDSNTAKDISTKLNVDTKIVYDMEKRLRSNISFSSNDFGSDGVTDDFIQTEMFELDYTQKHLNDPAIEFEQTEYHNKQVGLLKNAITLLDERSYDIISSRWLSENKATLDDLSKKYNVSKERIRQIEENALKKLRANIEL